jgi:hypothetical protein
MNSECMREIGTIEKISQALAQLSSEMLVFILNPVFHQAIVGFLEQEIKWLASVHSGLLQSGKRKLPSLGKLAVGRDGRVLPDSYEQDKSVIQFRLK